MRILFVHNARRSFVETDLRILASEHEVDELDLSVPARVAMLPVRLVAADLVYCWFASLHSLPAVALCGLLKKPVVVVVGGYDTADVPEIGYGYMGHPWKRHVVRWICDHASLLLANSKSAAEEARRNTGTRSPVRTIYHGFEAPTAEPAGDREALVLTVGRVEAPNLKRKGLEVFVRSAHSIPEARFVLAGEDSGDGSLEYLKSMAPQNLAIVGRLDDRDLSELYARASVYVQASAHEGFGCSLAEAMLHGCVPVISASGALPEVAGREAIVVDAGDECDVARGIREALSYSPEQHVQIARDALERFPLRERRTQLLALVDDVAAGYRNAAGSASYSKPARSLAPLDPNSCRVAVVIPTLNEADHIEATLGSVLTQTFPADRLQVMVVDGMSDDGTPGVVRQYAIDHPHLTLLENPSRTTPAALNLGIAASTAPVVVRVDGHCELTHNYIERCVAALARTGAANVGGLMRPRPVGGISEAVAAATRSRFGVGNARFHYLEREEEVDTVYLGAFRREVLHEVGGFDETLVRNQDDELNYRIRRAGYSIVLVPDIVSTYTPRRRFSALWRQYFQYGFWKVRVIQKHPGSAQVRHLAPLTLVCSAGGSLLLFIGTRKRMLLAPSALYSFAAVAATVRTARKRSTPGVPIFVAFLLMHFGYGTGFLLGVLDALRRALRSRG